MAGDRLNNLRTRTAIGFLAGMLGLDLGLDT